MKAEGAEPAEMPAQSAAPYHPDRLDLYLARRSNGAGPVYVALLTALLLMGAALPIVRVPTFVTGRGLVRAQLDGQVLVAAVEGRVVDMVPRDRYFLSAGDTVLRLERTDLLVRQRELHERAISLQRETADLLAMIGWSESAVPVVEAQSVRFGADWHATRDELARASARRAAAAREAERAMTLLERSLASAQEVEALRDRADELRRDSALLVSRAADRWRRELASLRAETNDLRAERAALAEQVDGLALRTPVEGWLDAVAALSRGSYVATGERVATITPSSPLIVEVYLDPAEVDRIRPGHPARLLPESRRFTGGAGARGRVEKIFPDLVRAGNAAVARLHVQLEGASVGGPEVAAHGLRRGTAVVVRFEVGRRSLWELLRWRREELNRRLPLPDAATPTSMG